MMDTIMNRIFARQETEVASFIDGMSADDQHKLASSFLLTQNVSERGGLYTMVGKLEAGQTLLIRGSGPAEISDIQPLELEAATVMPVVRIDKGRFVNGKELVLSPLHMVRCDIEHSTGINTEPRYAADGVALTMPIYMRIGDLVDGDGIRLDFMLTTAFRQIILNKEAAIYVEGQAIKVPAKDSAL